MIDRLEDAIDTAKDKIDDGLGAARERALELVDGARDTVEAAHDGVTDTVRSVFGHDPSGEDGESSVWEAWGHPELYSMVRTTVDLSDIQHGASEFGEISRSIGEVFGDIVNDLNGIVQGGWRGQAADAAVGALAPIREWSAELSATVSRTQDLIGLAGESAERTKLDIPPPVEFDTAQALRSAGLGMLVGRTSGALVAGGIDAVAQERAQDEARLEAVRVMNTTYSPPLLESKDSVPTYPRLSNPTALGPEIPPQRRSGPAPGERAPGVPGSGDTATGGQAQQQPQAYGSGVHPPGGVASPPAAAGQPGPVGTGSQSVLGSLGGSPQPGGGQAGAGGGVPPPVTPGAAGFGAAGGGQRSSGGRHDAARGPGLGGSSGRSGSGIAGGGSGPRSQGLPGGSPGGPRARGSGGAGAGGMPLGTAGAGRGGGDEDAEYQRKILILAEQDSIVGQIDPVSPPVIGEDPDVYQREDER